MDSQYQGSVSGFLGSKGLYHRQGIMNRKVKQGGNRRNMTTAVSGFLADLKQLEH